MKFGNKILSLILAALIACAFLVGCELPNDVSGCGSSCFGCKGNIDDNGGISGDNGGGGSGVNFDELDFSSDPYQNVSSNEFYKNYQPAKSYKDALYRSSHHFMSGTLGTPDQAPTVAVEQARENGLLIRNTSALYEDDGNTYIVLGAQGKEAFRVYKGGAYITLEEVAAYVYAFGDVPANYDSSKKTDPSRNEWGMYLRLNHTNFKGDTNKYPYEPELPNINGCGGELYYYEIDIGTTGTDCDPGYLITIYNDGNKITRGAARLVYTRFDKDGNNIIEPNERYVFYTYNHYNDFQEYLNYEGGWGEIFGNITGGGTLSSKSDYNPTPYVKIARRDFTQIGTTTSVYFFDRRATESVLTLLFDEITT